MNFHKYFIAFLDENQHTWSAPDTHRQVYSQANVALKYLHSPRCILRHAAIVCVCKYRKKSLSLKCKFQCNQGAEYGVVYARELDLTKAPLTL